MTTLLEDIGAAARQLRRQPRHTLLAVLLLALGQALGLTFFAVFDGVLLQPLPYAESDRLVHPWGVAESFGIDRYPYSWPAFVDYREGAESVEDLAATRTARFIVDLDGEPSSVSGARVTPNLLAVLGAAPLRGRDFDFDSGAADLGASAQADAALVSYGFWQRQLRGRPDVVGSTLRIDSEPFRVIGVLPEYFRYPNANTDILVPLILSSLEETRPFHFLRVTGRLAPGADFATAEAELQNIAARLAADHPDDHGELSLRLIPLAAEIVDQDSRQGLSGLFVGAHVLFLLACINVSLLLVVRTLARRSEIVLRFTLGASRRSLARRLSVENLLLAGLGCAIGTGIAVWVLGWIRSLAPDILPRAHEIAGGGELIFYSLGLFGVAVALFTFLPVPHALALSASLAESAGASQRTTASRRSRQVQALLVGGQVALALTLAFTAAMVAHSVGRLSRVDLGLESESVLAGGLQLAGAEFATQADQARFVDRVLPAVEAIPGVTSAGVFSRLPLSPGDASLIVFRPDQEGKSDLPNASFRVVTPRWRETVGIPLLEGRDLTAQDDSDPDRRSMLIDETLARRQWPDRSPIGQTLHLGTMGPWTVVGVIGATRLLRPDREPQFTVYVTPEKNPFLPAMNRPWFVARAAGDPAHLRQALRSALREAAPGQPILGLHTFREIQQDWLHERRVVASLLLVFGAAAIVLTAAGLFAVVSFAVEQRKTDFAIHAALGASPRRVFLRVFADGLRPVVIGGAVGVLAAGAIGVRLAPYLFATGPTDPGAAGAALGLLALAVLTAILPAAVRAGASDPARILRPLGKRL